jgi:polysaccharide deacetylase family protein (PEP-CTERM system associated)
MLLLSFDIEEWFLTNDPEKFPVSQWHTQTKRVEEATGRILELLSKKKRKATFFILGWIAEHYPRLVKEIVSRGHEIGFHSFWHHQTYKQNPEKFEHELLKGLALLEDITGDKIKFYRAPYFSINENSSWALPILIKHGIEIDSSVIAGTKIKGFLVPEEPVKIYSENNSLVEFPLSRFKIFGTKTMYSGSGYFRILPHGLLQRALRKSEYDLLYFHPRDFDPHTPWHSSLGLNRNLMNKVGAKGATRKLGKLLDQFSSQSLGEANESLVKSQSVLPLIRVS